ncbi:MAG TPA: Mpo1-like protein [Rhodanobacter sp.]|nr:Mpo1-like protein [Rhodanobacter sp.]
MTLPPPPDAQRLQAWLDQYGRDHVHPANRALHALCVPLATWSLIAMLWTLPVPQRWLQPGAWAVLAIVLTFYWYWKRSRTLAAALLAGFGGLALASRGAAQVLGNQRLFVLAAVVLVLAGFAQLIGQRLKGRRLRLPTQPAQLLIGPAWWMAALLHRLGIRSP